MHTTAKSPTPSRPARLMDNLEFRSRLSSWSNKQHQDHSKAGTILWYVSPLSVVSEAITWQPLQENYEVGCRESIAKEDVYHHYVAHCQAEGTEPLRASMFGKLVHRAFPGLKSSRIGTRGATRHSYKSFRPRDAYAMPSQAAAKGGNIASRSAGTRKPERPVVPLVQVKQQLPDEGMDSSVDSSSYPSSPMSSYSPRPQGQDEPRGQVYRQYAYNYYNDSSPTSFSSPTLPFETFSYTSNAFSAYLLPRASEWTTSKPQELQSADCACEECNQLAASWSGAVRGSGPAYLPGSGPSAGSFYGPASENSYWATQDSNMMRRQLPMQFADYLCRDLEAERFTR
ncbi:RFX DNAbinding domain containing protein [Acanthamoeba castellanii str. Neff]|uniref:RFX DNAbinding domain containing protein n=1 Tax=Acanthamoeba castellanii (strain ATCC 30010 / Neff) TaxID=1257118 RepID=L8HIW3_ACACF|nr:RFX DNAbinding domain containing protein [Acanthamoeba castellanii str. Neff]ELR25125.1 RFX DNAbinding domain containing protein [Acanthamoeba castellanii str. Neff]